MDQIVYVNGSFVPIADAKVSVFDRGFLFADGIYEVAAVLDGKLIDNASHLARLERSVGEIKLALPETLDRIQEIQKELIARNRLVNGLVYLQVTRGVAPRDHAFPKAAKPVLVVTSRRSRPPDPRLGRDGIAVITIPDIGWQRCDIKSVALVANVLGKQQAREAGAYEAWQIDREGQVTEGTSTNAWIVTADDTVITRVADHAILNGVTRAAILDIIRREGYRLVERPFTVAEAKTAREAFLTSTTADLLPVVRIDGAPVADGKPGPLSRKLREAYLLHAAAAA